MAEIINVTLGYATGAFLTKHYDEAAQSYAALSRLHPDNAAYLSNCLMASVYAQKTNEDALNKCLDCMDDPDASPDVLFALYPFYTEDNLKLVAECLKEVCARQPNRVGAAVALAETYAALGDSEALKNELKQIFPRFGRDERVLCLNASYALACGNTKQAGFLFRRAMALNAPYTLCCDALYDYLEETGALKKIIRYAKKALKITPENVSIKKALLEAYICTEQYKNAEELFADMDKSADIMSDAVLFFWAKTLAGQKRYADAFDVAYRISSDTVDKMDVFFFLGKMLYFLKESNQTNECIKRAMQWKNDFSDNEIIVHSCNAILGETQTPTPTPVFAQTIFDNMADDFEQILLKKQKYKGAAFLEKYLKKAPLDKKKEYDVLDLGCGTGLVAPVLKQIAGKKKKLVGVDVSSRMLKYAREKRLYSKLVQTDILSFFKEEKETFDVVSCMDVFICFGDIQPVLNGVYRALRNDGLFVFTIVQNTCSETPFALLPSGRYVHSVSYTTALLEQEGFTILAQEECALRSERNHPIMSTVFLVQKQNVD